LSPCFHMNGKVNLIKNLFGK